MPLTQAQIDIVKSTVPILRTGGETLTKHFYKMLFRDFPQTKIFFNHTHQATGDQPRALANSVLMYAENIETLGNLGPLAAQIVNKHVALQVQPEHYPIVGQCLLKSIREVLGEETATDAVLEAWGAAYGQLADMLIGAEAAAYNAIAEAEGGWRGARAFTVAKKVAESDVITSFVLAPADGKAVTKYEPGQYLGLQLQVGGEEVRRNYSLSQAADGATLRISVKREPKGLASGYLHGEVAEGATLNVFAPAGEFVLAKSTAPVPRHTLLLSAGVGVTPLFAMLQHLSAHAAPGATVSFVNFSKTAQSQAFAKDVEAIVAARPATFSCKFIHTSESNGAVGSANEAASVDAVIAALPPSVAASLADVDAYIVGPKGFLRAMRKGLIAKGVPTEQVRFEFFGPAASLE